MEDTAFFVEGYASEVSYAPGELVQLHVSSPARFFSVEISRLGYKQEVVLRKERVSGSVHTVPDDASSQGCAWPVSWEFLIPLEWESGYYQIIFRINDQGDTFTHRCSREATSTSYFILRPAVSSRRSSILLQLSTNTYAAYNNWGGYSLYAYHGRGGVQGHRVSFERPDSGLFERWELPFVSWAERSGYKLDYCSNLDLERYPELLDNHALVLSVGHDEYWSAAMRDNVENFISYGGNVAFFSGNSVCWQVRVEDDGRALTCWKQRFNQDPAYRGDRTALTTLWSHHLVKRPENQLTGVGFLHGGYHLSHGQYMDGSGAFTVHRPEHWVFSNTKLQVNDEFGGKDTIVGYECDGCEIEWREGLPYPTGNDGTPTNFHILATASAKWHPDDSDWYDAWQPGREGCAVMGLYQQGGTVFTVGTTDWSHGLAKLNGTVDIVTKNIIDKLAF